MTGATHDAPDEIESLDTGTDRRNRFGLVLAIAALVVAVDQASKALAVRFLSPEGPVEVLGSVLQLNLVRNSGAAFSLGTGSTLILSAIAVVIVVVVVRFAATIESGWWALALGGLLGGAVGNLIDRALRPPGLFRGEVVDFIQLPHWPVFNVADMAIVGSAGILIMLAVRGVPLRAGKPGASGVG